MDKERKKKERRRRREQNRFREQCIRYWPELYNCCLSLRIILAKPLRYLSVFLVVELFVTHVSPTKTFRVTQLIREFDTQDELIVRKIC